MVKELRGNRFGPKKKEPMGKKEAFLSPKTSGCPGRSSNITQYRITGWYNFFLM
jgi:hypothetical protein